MTGDSPDQGRRTAGRKRELHVWARQWAINVRPTDDGGGGRQDANVQFSSPGPQASRTDWLRCALTRHCRRACLPEGFLGTWPPPTPTWHTRRCGSWRRFIKWAQMSELMGLPTRDGILAPTEQGSRTARTETPGPLGQTQRLAIGSSLKGVVPVTASGAPVRRLCTSVGSLE